MKFRTLSKRMLHFPSVMVLALVIIIAILIRHFKPSPAKLKDKPADTTVSMPFRTISAAGDKEELYAYELHRRRIPQDNLPEYCAIIRNINPATDDYKAYCKLVVNDVVRTTGNRKIIIYIYDSNEAYQLYESKYLQQMQNLSDSELSLVADHHIATYLGERTMGEWETSKLLSYYEDAQNGLAMQEVYSAE